MRVLIVEDEHISRKLLQRLLSAYGECDIAVNGREAIDAFRMSMAENKPYDFICMDILMPEVDGLQALSAIRDMEYEMNIAKQAMVKVIMTTTMTDPKSLATALIRLGVGAYLVKPFSKQRLLYEMQKLGLIEQLNEKAPIKAE